MSLLARSARVRVVRAALSLCAVASLCMGCRRGNSAKVGDSASPDAAAPRASSAGAIVPDAGARTVPAPPKRPTVAVFGQVLAPSARPVRVFAAGTRALVSRGPAFVGWAEQGKPMVTDASLSTGLPAAPYDAPQLLAGSFPKLMLVYGRYAGSGSDEKGFFAYQFRGSAWVRVGSTGFDRPWSLAAQGAGFGLFDAPSFHLENGVLPMTPEGKPVHRCEDSPRLPFTLGFGAPALTAPPRFFPMEIASDGKGQLAGWGYDTCKPGAHAVRVQRGVMSFEPLPGTAACTERDPANGLPLVRAKLFPAADGGAFALVGSDVRYDERGAPYVTPMGDASTPCMAAPLLLRRAPEGAWAVLGAPLPADGAKGPELVSGSAVDPAGTAFLMTPRATVLRVEPGGAVTELGLAPSCLAADTRDAGTTDEEEPIDDADASASPEIIEVQAPFVDDVWVTVKRGTRLALCRAANARLAP